MGASAVKRRAFMAAAGGATLDRQALLAETYTRATRGLPPLKVTNVESS